ncbi:IclR family transcriptional regulator [Leucobacter coleopterorum]|uniref:IclR family transcriptional regulator n=1 Tax=Leucobacter coleopterorum TaxID=2714933 RepID=A0ABX6JZ39_9MICO|nr:IclR family transcriptional regulator [Leucobacter coleopterorum]QIM19571.1 IclR family transcriptional regulator [Leucobacter coleopterorum]
MDRSTDPGASDDGRINATGLGRDIRLLEMLASDAATRLGGYGVTELAKLTGRSKTVVSRALATLATTGLAARDPETQRYRVGPRVFALAARSAEAELVQSGQPVLRSLVGATHETAHLCVLMHGNVLTLASELSPHELRSAGWQGVRTAAWRSSSGWVLLSDWDETALRQWYDERGHDSTVIGDDVFGREASPFSLHERPPASTGKVRDFEGLLAEIERIRAVGYSVLDEDLEEGIVGVSAPVLDHTGRVVAALNVSGPKKRLGDKIEALGGIVRQAGATLSRRLGGPGSCPGSRR